MTVSFDTFVRTLGKPPSEYAWAWALEHPATEPLRICVVHDLAIETRKPPDQDELVLWFGVPAKSGWDFFGALDENERMRAGKFQFEADRWAFTAAHAGLRALLGPMAACAPDALRFALGRNGKPRLDQGMRGPQVEFSISHTRGCVAVALSKRSVGVDVEQRRPMPDMMAVARMAFAREGYDSLAACSEPHARMALFYRYWTLGEAFIKATGEGVSQDLTSFAFTEKDPPALTRVSAPWGPQRRWRFYSEP
jgi:4'-phosphopantetheinyl transferase